jgi:hypothetical protein
MQSKIESIYPQLIPSALENDDKLVATNLPESSASLFLVVYSQLVQDAVGIGRNMDCGANLVC